MDEQGDSAAWVAALNADIDVLRRERDLLRAELTETRAERDRLRILILELEIELAAREVREVETVVPVLNTVDTERARLAEEQVAFLRRELAATRRTISWRVTAPLRFVRRRMIRS